MDKTSILYVGLDVHNDSIDIATADAGRDGEVRFVGSIGGDLAALDKSLRKLVSRGQPLQVVYEAGPCGFVVWRHLSALVTACEPVAHSSIPKHPGDRVNTDRRDALSLAGMRTPANGTWREPRRCSRHCPTLSPDTNSLVDCLCLTKGRATGPARPARLVGRAGLGQRERTVVQSPGLRHHMTASSSEPTC